MDSEQILKIIRPCIVDNEMTWDDFDKIFGTLRQPEQYAVAEFIQDDLKIELVDEIISLPVEEISKENKPLISRNAQEIQTTNNILVRLIQSGDEQARQDLCIKNLGLVEKFVAKYTRFLNSQLTFEDLVQEGTIGMLKAAEKFDFSKGTQFSTYATWWIVQAITRAIADTGLTVRLPVHVVEKILKVSRYEKIFMIQGLDLKRRIELTAQEMQTTPEEIGNLLALRAAYMNIVSLDKPVDDEDGDSILMDFIKEPNTPDPSESVTVIILKEQLEKALNTLTPREKDVLKLRYGIEDGKERTLEEIGKIFNLTRERIRQIEFKALRKLRHPAHSKKLKDFWD